MTGKGLFCGKGLRILEKDMPAVHQPGARQGDGGAYSLLIGLLVWFRILGTPRICRCIVFVPAFENYDAMQRKGIAHGLEERENPLVRFFRVDDFF